MPQVEIDPVELDIWRNLGSEECDVATAAELLVTARDNGTRLSSRSLDFLALDDPSEQVSQSGGLVRDRSVVQHGPSTPSPRYHHHLLCTQLPALKTAYVLSVKDAPMKQDTVITCMETLKKVGNEPDGVSSLVIGTENKRVLILDPAATSMQCR